jgi:hypothetical protein
VAYNPAGDVVAVAFVSSPFIYAYPWASGYGTRYANPSTLPSFTGASVTFNSVGTAIAVGSQTPIGVYPWSSGFGAKYANPATLPTTTANGVAFSPN